MKAIKEYRWGTNEAKPTIKNKNWYTLGHDEGYDGRTRSGKKAHLFEDGALAFKGNIVYLFNGWDI